MRLITYGFHDKRGGREARLRRALDDADRRYPQAVTVEATITDDPLGGRVDDKAVIRVEVTVRDEDTSMYDRGPETRGYIGVDEFGHPMYEDGECDLDPIECAMIRERSVAGISDDIPSCPTHGEWARAAFYGADSGPMDLPDVSGGSTIATDEGVVIAEQRHVTAHSGLAVPEEFSR